MDVGVVLRWHAGLALNNLFTRLIIIHLILVDRLEPSNNEVNNNEQKVAIVCCMREEKINSIKCHS